MNFGWNLFTATSNIKLVSCLRFFSLSSLPLPPKTPIHIKTVTKRRITELPNCFYTIVSLTHSLSLLLHCCRGRSLVLLAIVMLYTHKHIHIYAREKKKKCNERNCKKRERITVADDGNYYFNCILCTQ